MGTKLEKMIGPGRAVELFALVISWILVSLYFFPSAQTAPKAYVAWIALVSWLSLTTLDWIGYFELHIPKPKFSGLVSLLLALPFSALLTKWILTGVSWESHIGHAQAVQAALLAAAAFESAQVLIFKAHRALGSKSTLLTRLHPEDSKALNAQIEGPVISEWIRARPLEAAPSKAGRGAGGREAVVISRRSVNNLQDCSELVSAHLGGKSIVDYRQLLKELRGRVDLSNYDGWSFLLTSTPQIYHIRLYFHLKTVLEPVLAFALAVLLLPFLAVVGVAVFWTSGWPILYSQERVGYRGKKFMMYKFRTMSNSAESDGAVWATRDDPRVTPLGRWLRRARIDELPQLFNVIIGDLGFVGPRPERPEFYQLLSAKVPLFSMRLLVRPGITGWAQIRQGYAATVEESRTKLEYDLYYVQNMSPKLDFRVLIETAAMMLRGSSGR